MMRNIFALLINDLAVASKNKTIYLVLFIPLFVFVTLKLTDQSGLKIEQIKIGLINGYVYSPKIIDSINSAEKIIFVKWINNEKEGEFFLKEKKIDGVLLGNKKDSGNLTLLVLKKESLHTLAILEIFSALQKAADGIDDNWIANIETLYTGDIQKQTLPTWILMIILLIGFIILPAQVAEEKEKKLLLALLQTPIGEGQWLIAKAIMGMILTLMAISFLHLLGNFGVDNLFGYIALIVAGSFCFSTYGILLGFLCRSQASARTLGVVFYLPHLLPSALSDYSQQLTAVAPFLPSYQLYEPLKAILLEEGRTANISFELASLFVVGTVALYLSYLLIKKRWLM